MSQHPYVVVYREGSRDVIERHWTPQSVNKRLNELWGPGGPNGPICHREARGMLASRVRDIVHQYRNLIYR